MAKKSVSAYGAHETRMWIKEVIIPTVSMLGLGAIALSDPDTRKDVKDMVRDGAAKVAYKIQTIKEKLFHK